MYRTLHLNPPDTRLLPPVYCRFIVSPNPLRDYVHCPTEDRTRTLVLGPGYPVQGAQTSGTGVGPGDRVSGTTDGPSGACGDVRRGGKTGNPGTLYKSLLPKGQKASNLEHPRRGEDRKVSREPGSDMWTTEPGREGWTGRQGARTASDCTREKWVSEYVSRCYTKGSDTAVARRRTPHSGDGCSDRVTRVSLRLIPVPNYPIDLYRHLVTSPTLRRGPPTSLLAPTFLVPTLILNRHHSLLTPHFRLVRVGVRSHPVSLK